jgi:hypothetical protein
MANEYVYVKDLREQARVPENGILSQTLHSDERSKTILFGFAAGQELSALRCFFSGETPRSGGAPTPPRPAWAPSSTCLPTWSTASRPRPTSSCC